MKLMTNVLLITNKQDITTDFIVRELTKQNLTFYRLNTEEIGTSVQLNFNLDDGVYEIIDTIVELTINLADITNVYYRRPEIKSDFPETTSSEKIFLQRELLASLDHLYTVLSDARWLNSIPAIRKAENKPYQLLIAKELGFDTPSSLITNSPRKAMAFFEKLNGQCIIKPLRHGLIQEGLEERIVFTSKVTLDETNNERIASCPVYLQKHIQKKADIRVTVVGEKVFAAMIDSQQSEESQVDWRRSVQSPKHSKIDLPLEINNKCVALVKRMNLQFGAIDFVLDKNSAYIFLEINPNGQWAWIERQLGYPIAKTITQILLEKDSVSY